MPMPDKFRLAAEAARGFMPAAEGLDWNDCGNGAPFAVVKAWPMRLEPTT